MGTKLLAKHQGRAHKLAIEPGSPHIFYTCGEDGLVQHVSCKSISKFLNKIGILLEGVILTTVFRLRLLVFSIQRLSLNLHLYAYFFFLCFVHCSQLKFELVV